MIAILYTDESVCGELGPNLYWRGEPGDYLRLANDLHMLGVSNGNELQLNSLEYINHLNGLKLTLKSSDGGQDLCIKNGSTVTMDLRKEICHDILVTMLMLSFYECHDYIDFDELNLNEYANVIMSSGAKTWGILQNS